uniref:Uncharacterized protein n=1 Tax=Anopheles farauti TaxID=69004 RepID=A0A182QFN3_9DIPT
MLVKYYQLDGTRDGDGCRYGDGSSPERSRRMTPALWKLHRLRRVWQEWTLRQTKSRREVRCPVEVAAEVACSSCVVVGVALPPLTVLFEGVSAPLDDPSSLPPSGMAEICSILLIMLLLILKLLLLLLLLLMLLYRVLVAGCTIRAELGVHD